MGLGFDDTGDNYQVISDRTPGVIGHPAIMTVTVDTGARDGGPAGGASQTELHPGLVLGMLTADGQFTDYDTDASDGTENEGDCVILAERIKDISTGDQRALVYVGDGAYNFQKLRFRLAADKSAFEREKASFSFYNTI